jgi:surfeit locus 1 family protein
MPSARRLRFTFRPVPFIATVLVVALGVSLGQWQDRRAAGKIALQQQLAARSVAAPLVLGDALLDPQDAEFRKVRVTGEFLRDWPLFLDNRPQENRTGFYLLMPFKIAGTQRHVLVARGWLPRNNAEHDKLPPFATPEGTVTIEGVARAGMGHVMQLGTPAPVRPQAILQNLEVAEFAAASGLAVQPVFVEETDAGQPGDGLKRAWPAPALNVEKHKGYAFQWYALSAMALLFFVFTGFKQREPSQAE